MPSFADDFESQPNGAGVPRWHIDAATLSVLEHIFSIDQFPNVEVRNKLGADLNVTARQVQVWFQNRRQRERKRSENNSKKGSAAGCPTMQQRSSSMSSSQATLSLSSEGLCLSSEDLSLDNADGGDDGDELSRGCDAGQDGDDVDSKKRRGVGLPLAPMPKLPHIHTEEGPSAADVETASNLSDSTIGMAEPSPNVAAATAASAMAASAPVTSISAEQLSAAPAAAVAPPPLVEGEYDWRAAQRNLLPHTVGGLDGRAHGAVAGGVDRSNAAVAVHHLNTLLREHLAAEPSAQQVPALPDVATRLAAACQSTLLGRTVQQFGGIVQAITEAAPPYAILSVSNGWQALSGYHREEVIGLPLGFLHGPLTQRPALTTLMESVRREQPVSVRLTNYTKAGLPFTHQLSVEPLRDPSGVTRCYQATSLVLLGPGEMGAAGEAEGHEVASLASCGPLPPLWPLLGNAVRPELLSGTGVLRGGAGTPGFSIPTATLAAQRQASDALTIHQAPAAAAEEEETFDDWFQMAESCGGGGELSHEIMDCLNDI